MNNNNNSVEQDLDRRRRRLTVLVVGLDFKQDNQFTRHATRLGCDVIRASGDPGADYPTDCDACILVKSHVSHAKFWHVKETYKGDRLFVSNFGGFSEIKDPFEAYIVARKLEQLPSGTTRPTPFRNNPVITPVFEEQEKNTETEQPEVEVVVRETVEEKPMLTTTSKYKSPKYSTPDNKLKRCDPDRIFDLVLDCQANGFSAKDTALYFDAEGLGNSAGRRIGPQEVYTYRWAAKQKGLVAKTNSTLVPKSIARPGTERSPVAVERNESKRDDGESNMADLINQVFANQSLKESQKLELIAKITRREITKAKGVSASIIKDANGEPLLRLSQIDIANYGKPANWITLSQHHAELLVEAADKVYQFATTGRVG